MSPKVLATAPPAGAQAWELHLGVDSAPPEAADQHQAILRYRTERCALYLGIEHG